MGVQSGRGISRLDLLPPCGELLREDHRQGRCELSSTPYPSFLFFLVLGRLLYGLEQYVFGDLYREELNCLTKLSPPFFMFKFKANCKSIFLSYYFYLEFIFNNNNKQRTSGRLIQLQRFGMTTLMCVREIVEIVKDQLSRWRELQAAILGPHLIWTLTFPFFYKPNRYFDQSKLKSGQFIEEINFFNGWLYLFIRLKTNILVKRETLNHYQSTIFTIIFISF